MFLRTPAEEDTDLRHQRETNGLSFDDPSRGPGGTPASVTAAALWAAAGIASGAVLTGLIGPGAGVAAAGAAAIAGAAAWGRTHHPAPPRAPEDPSGEVPSTLEIDLGPGRLDEPRSALAGLLRSTAGAFGSGTAIVLSLDASGENLVLEGPLIDDGDIRDLPALRRYPVAGGGSLRVALASDAPVAARRAAHTTAWDNFADEFRIEGAMLAPLRIGAEPLGVLVVGLPDGRPDAVDLRRMGDALRPLACAFGALLRLRDQSEAAADRAQSERFRSDYASVIGHELRTPLTTILGVLKTVSRPELAPANEDARDLIGMAVIQGERLRRLIEDMAAVAHIDEGIPIRPELVHVATLVERAVETVPGAADLTTLRITEDLPPLILDPEHVRRILAHLVGNAVKYGEGAPILVGAAREGDDLVLTVADRGPGMPEEAAARAFEPYEQPVRTEVDAYGGVGLGLSICRGLTEAMGGGITHRPTRGGGATFVVRLPAKQHLRA